MYNENLKVSNQMVTGTKGLHFKQKKKTWYAFGKNIPE